MGRLRQILVSFFSLWLLFSISLPAEGAPQGALLDSDFAYRGVALGDTEEALLKAYGEPLFDRTMQKQGVTLRVYTFRGGIDVGVSVRTRRVVDFVTGGEALAVREGIKEGATKHLIWLTYGKVGRRYLDGSLAYVYTRPAHPHDHLVLFLDAETEALKSVRLTSLPLTEEEADEAAQEAEMETEAETETLPAEGDIDVSALPPAETIRLGGLLP